MYNLEVHFSWTDGAIILGNRHCEYNLTCSLRKSVRGNDKYNCWGRNPKLPAILLHVPLPFQESLLYAHHQGSNKHVCHFFWI